jgi:hypothetical protein
MTHKVNNLSRYKRAGLVGWRVWRGNRRAITHYAASRVRKVNGVTGQLCGANSWEEFYYLRGSRPPNYPVPAPRSVVRPYTDDTEFNIHVLKHWLHV